MTNHTRSSQCSLAALLLAGLSAACMSDPLAGTDLSDDAGQGGTGTGGTTSATGGTTSTTGGAGGTTASATIAGNGGTVSSWPVTNFTVLVSPEREVDILFMIDNSPSMDPKQTRLAANFPKMIQVLQQIPDGSGGTSLPDVHIGVISSDMGAGSEPLGVNCMVLGDRGLLYGNDPNNPLASVAPTADPMRGGHPDPNGCGLHSCQRWISDVANPNGLGRVKNYDGNIEDVFACLAKAVGTNGCGYEHQLQSLRVALTADYPANPKDAPNTINPENIGFVRPKAFLSIVLVTDEDDCSADPVDPINDSMFLQSQNPITETASLKCAARGHVCNGRPIPGYNDPSIGYQPPNPLPQPNIGFSTAFSNCAAKDQPNPANPVPDHHYLPLIRVQDMIDSVNGLTAWVVDANGNYVYDANGDHVSLPKPPGSIFVSGIIGWPVGGDLTGVNYQIGIDTTSLPAPQNTYWDYMPICTVPTITGADGNIYKAYGGLRLKKFIDAFQKTYYATGPGPNTFSLCDDDFTKAMTEIGAATAIVLKPGCVQYPLMDTDPNTPGTQPRCRVIDQIACDTPGTPLNCLGAGYEEFYRDECIDPTTGLPLDPATAQDNLNKIPNTDSARPCWYLYYDTSTAGCPDAPKGQRITVLRKSGETAPAGTLLSLSCMTCPASNPDCGGAGH